ncbi:MAG TPA: hypothetical protein VET30_08240 [Pseudoxanthomonas sp.]|nr:hypothetical protein [Pseudoxanthomonas sp.]
MLRSEYQDRNSAISISTTGKIEPVAPWTRCWRQAQDTRLPVYWHVRDGTPGLVYKPAKLIAGRGLVQTATGITPMGIKLRAGSMELEVAFIDWLRTQGYNPVDGIDPFFTASEFVRSQLLLIDESEKQALIEETRLHLQRRSSDPVFAGQFPLVYACLNEAGEALRYTVALTLSDESAEWTGRVWNGSDYLGEIQGSGSGPHAHYLELARMHIESQVKRPGAIKHGDR